MGGAPARRTGPINAFMFARDIASQRTNRNVATLTNMVSKVRRRLAKRSNAKVRLYSTRFFVRNHFVSNLVLDSLKFKRLLDLHRKIQTGTLWKAIANWYG